jgi:hypothetical protein
LERRRRDRKEMERQRRERQRQRRERPVLERQGTRDVLVHGKATVAKEEAYVQQNTVQVLFFQGTPPAKQTCRLKF